MSGALDSPCPLSSHLTETIGDAISSSGVVPGYGTLVANYTTCATLEAAFPGEDNFIILYGVILYRTNKSAYPVRTLTTYLLIYLDVSHAIYMEKI